MSWPHSGKQKPGQPATKVRSFADLKNSHLVRSDHLGEESTQSRSLGGNKDSKQRIGKPPVPRKKKYMPKLNAKHQSLFRREDYLCQKQIISVKGQRTKTSSRALANHHSLMKSIHRASNSYTILSTIQAAHW